MQRTSDTAPPGDVPITPDFYAYAWHPLVRAELGHDAFVRVAWADGRELACYALWLAESSPGLGIEPSSRESTIDPADLPLPGDLRSAAVGGRGELVLSWVDGLRTVIHPGWLRHVADERHLPSSYLPGREAWTAATFTEPPSLDGADVLTDDAVLTEWLVLLVRFGLARLRNVPATEDFLEELVERIGPIRASNFGKMFSVRSIVDPDSTAYTGLNLGQHTDLPTRETPPGYQFLHCVENTVAGGWSRMTDGLAVVAELQEHHPADYDALTTLDWVWFNRQRSEDHRWIGPMIDHGSKYQPLALRAFYPVRGFPHMAAADVPRAYTAMRRFSSIAHDPRFQVRYPFAPGDVVGFDNRQVLHGRDAFDPGGGSRFLRGCYLDQDDLYSRLRVLRRHQEAAACGASAAGTPLATAPGGGAA
jgi:gamma-butyrobetaine dioxygenase